mgnify:CR=1 FL=1
MPPTLPSTSISGAFIAKLGAWLQLAQFIGFAGTVKGIMKAFEALGTATPSEDPGHLRMAIGEVLKSAFTGICISLIGILLILISIVVCRYRAPWMFWFLCLYGGLMTPTYFFPFGLFFLIYALVKKEEFLRPSASAIAA